MKKIVNYLLVLMTLLSVFQYKANATEKDNDELDIAQLPDTISRYIPEGYQALNATRGDLNQDAIEDVILIVKKRDEEKTSDMIEHPEKRPLFILTGQTDNSYKLAAKSDNAVLCVDCGGVMGDPFMGVTIKKGYFSVEHYGGSAWRWTMIVTFKYSKTKKKWFLHKYGGDEFHVSEPDNTTTNVQSTKDFGVVAFEDFNIYQ